MDFLRDLVERRIREAQEHGLFDNLAGQGKPLPLAPDDLDRIDHDEWLVNKVLKTAGCLPPWVDLAKEIDYDEEEVAGVVEEHRAWLDRARAALASLPEAERLRRRASLAAIHAHYRARYTAVLEELSVKVDRFNHIVPVRTLEKPGVWVARLVRRLDERFAELAAAGWPATDELVGEPGPGAPGQPPSTGTEDLALGPQSSVLNPPDPAQRVLDLTRALAQAREAPNESDEAQDVPRPIPTLANGHPLPLALRARFLRRRRG